MQFGVHRLMRLKNYLLTLLVLFAAQVANAQDDQKVEEPIDTSIYHIVNDYELLKEAPFQPGEQIELKASIGWVKGAEATIGISDIIYTTNDRPTWKMEVNVRTVGIFDLVSSVRDTWGSYIDTTNYQTQQYYRYIKEGRYRKNEIVYFDHEKDSVHVAKLHKETRALERTVDFRASENVHDMVSSYYYLRAVDWSKFDIGDVITINIFFDDKLKPERVKIVDREVIKTKLGKVKAVALVPIHEEDELFVEENTIKIWLSDDLNRIPLKAKAKIYVGYVTVSLKDAKNLRHPLALVD